MAAEEEQVDESAVAVQTAEEEVEEEQVDESAFAV